MVKNQKMKLINIAFKLLKYNYLTNYKKYGQIIEKFDLRKKSMIFYMIYDEYIIQSKKRFLLRQKLISSFNIFLNKIKIQKEQKYYIYEINKI